MFLQYRNTSRRERDLVLEKVVQKKNRQLSVDDLEQALELTDKDDIKDEQSMLKGIIRFGDETTKEVMTSRIDTCQVGSD